MNPSAKLAAAMGLVVALAIAALFVFRSAEEDAVEALLRDVVAYAQRGDAEACIATVAPDYAFNGETYEGVCALARTYVTPGRWKAIEIDKVGAVVEGDAAKATLDLWITPRDSEPPFRTFLLRIHFHLKKAERDAWKICGYRLEER